jgi:hypothetical protein
MYVYSTINHQQFFNAIYVFRNFLAEKDCPALLPTSVSELDKDLPDPQHRWAGYN